MGGTSDKQITMHIQAETERLCLRPLTIDDNHFISELLNTKGWLENIGDRNVKSINDASDYILKILENFKCYYTVFRKRESPESIGIVTFLYRDDQAYPFRN